MRERGDSEQLRFISFRKCGSVRAVLTVDPHIICEFGTDFLICARAHDIYYEKEKHMIPDINYIGDRGGADRYQSDNRISI